MQPFEATGLAKDGKGGERRGSPQKGRPWHNSRRTTTPGGPAAPPGAPDSPPRGTPRRVELPVAWNATCCTREQHDERVPQRFRWDFAFVNRPGDLYWNALPTRHWQISIKRCQTFCAALEVPCGTYSGYVPPLKEKFVFRVQQGGGNSDTTPVDLISIRVG